MRSTPTPSCSASAPPAPEDLPGNGQAVSALQTKRVTRIILGRVRQSGPVAPVPAGHSERKIDPYLRPLYDALHDMMDPRSDPQADKRRRDRGGAIRAGLHAGPSAGVCKVLTPSGFRPIRGIVSRRLGCRLRWQTHRVLGVYPGVSKDYRDF